MLPGRLLSIAFATAVLSYAAADPVSAQSSEREPFHFVAFGDMPYRTPGDFARLENLISGVNEDRPPFSVHVGDIKNGILNCSTDYYLAIRKYFDSFDSALVYTPGDNDWADCDRILAGGYDTRERLAELRRVFFAGPFSMGREPMPLIRQADAAGHPDMVENALWNYGGVIFATVHMVGTDNNLGDDREEFEARNAANIAWIETAFRKAIETNNAGVVLMFHADIFSSRAPQESFANAISAIAAGAELFRRPVLLINGDSHSFGIDNPVRHSVTGLKNRKITRVIVFGDDKMHAVQISVNPESPDLFSIKPLIIKNNNSN